MNSQPVVSAVVVNWNGARDLERGLPSLVAQSYPLEILVMDNGSTDASESVVRAHPPVQWVPLGSNLGLAPALNRGASIAKGELLLLLNNDMRFDSRFVEALVAEIQKSEDVFAVDGLQWDWDGKQIVHAATYLGNAPGPDPKLSHEMLSGLWIWQEVADSPTPVFMTSAANMMVRRSMFFELGGFDERLPIGYEDVDLCWRGWMRGWKSVFVPSAVCWHDVAKSSRSPAGARIRYKGTLGGKLLFATKLLPPRYAALIWGRSALGVVKDVLHRRKDMLEDRLSTLWKFGGYVPRLLAERREVYRAAARTPAAQLAEVQALGGRRDKVS